MPLVSSVTLFNEKFTDLITPSEKVVIEFRNKTNFGVRVRCLGIHLDSNFVMDLDANETMRISTIGAGERVVAAWDSVTLDLVYVAHFDMTRNGRVKIENIIEQQATTNVTSEDVHPVSLNSTNALFEVQQLEPLDIEV